ncbi:MAG: M1 family aminopeptidase [Rhodothermales bacterium]|nr:M1 family aminopeptidase [Rhodothermales bacterium]
MTNRLRLASLLLLLAGPAGAQNAAFDALPVPAPTAYRSASGAPGEHYWQQRADYRIEAVLDPVTHRIEGTVTILYTNNSPHALDYLWLHLDQNLFAPNSRGARLHGADSRWRGAFEGGGMTVDAVTVSINGELAAIEPEIDDTRLRIPLQTPLLPGGAVAEVSMDFAFVVPEHGADRMGRLDVEQGPLYQIAQWYPRMAVYDDVEGWNAMPYLGQGEFYLEYGDFDVSLTAPSDFLVVATGELANPEEVYTDEQRRRLERAMTSDETIAIVEPGEVGRRESRPGGEGLLTWRFLASNVRDFAWAASPAFILDAASYNGILLLSAYPREGLGTTRAPGWERATDYLRHALKHHAETWHPYPYPTAITVAGRVRGMEYPMVIFCALDDRGQELYGVTDHEIAHTWFPMLVGSDERRYGWMDEGFATFITYFTNRAMYGDAAERLAWASPEYVADQMRAPLAAQPSMMPADHIQREAVGFLSYRKPAFGLLLLREYILGPDRFDAAFRTYIARWAYRHPQPADFFRTIEDATGEDLTWFWRGWFYGSAAFNPSLEPTEAAGRQSPPTFAIHQPNGVLLPIDVRFEYVDGTSETMRLSVDGYAQQDYIVVVARAAELRSVHIDPDHLLPDVDRSDNQWPR